MRPCFDTSCFASNVRDMSNGICQKCPSNIDCGVEEAMRYMEEKYGPEEAEIRRREVTEDVRDEVENLALAREQQEARERNNVRPFPGKRFSSSPYFQNSVPPQQSNMGQNNQTNYKELSPNGFVGSNPIAYSPRQQGESFWGRLAKNMVCEAIAQGAREAAVSIHAEKFTPTGWFRKKPEIHVNVKESNDEGEKNQ